MSTDFVVIGRVNEGKSSVIATLIEDENIDIGAAPGTTSANHHYEYKHDEECLLTICDTPGFQQPEAVLDWFKSREPDSAAKRPEVVKAFIATPENESLYPDEWTLLQPILKGNAVVLYVVDSSHPYRPSCEAELEILRWTGAPRVAVLNDRSARQEGWDVALNQYFNLVIPFNAHHSRLHERVRLLSELKVIVNDNQEKLKLERIVRIIEQRAEVRIKNCARLVADCLADILQLQVSKPLTDYPEEAKQKAVEKWFSIVENKETNTRRKVEEIHDFRKSGSTVEPLDGGVFSQDILAEEVWQVLGLDKGKLVATGAVGGAAAGVAVDVAAGLHSLFAGAAIGSAIGAGSALWYSSATPTVKSLGTTIAGTNITVGPLKHPNFPWVLLDRSLLHLEAVAKRTHAQRGELKIQSREQSPSSNLNADTRKKLGKVFQKLGARGGAEHRIKLAEVLEEFMIAVNSSKL